jgi:cbb3-type cytochrome oxidase cytochrome c subunit
MNYGPLLFLAAFFALASSWFGLVLMPQVQVGQLQPTNTLGTATSYPLARPGIARQGLEVYRANGCASCHSQQITQTGTACEITLTEAGTNQPALLAALLKVKPLLSQADAAQLIKELPKPILQGVQRPEADAALKALTAGGAKAALWIVPVGPDLARGWGKRRSVAEDSLYDYPVMLGSVRVGPDLADVAARQPDVNWHLLHLYAPRLKVKDSVMPQYRFLFVQRKIERCPSPEALVLPSELAPPAGYEVLPKSEAQALVAYLLSLRADAPLYVAPVTVPASGGKSEDRNPKSEGNPKTEIRRADKLSVHQGLDATLAFARSSDFGFDPPSSPLR